MEEGMETDYREQRDAARRRPKSPKLFIATGAAIASLYGPHALAISPVTTCSSAGIGSVILVGDGPPVTILSATPSTTPAPASVPYCLVKVLVPQAINIWVGLPTNWNGRWQSLGGGGYAGSVSAPTSAVNDGYAGAMTDTGHTGGSGTFGFVNDCVGNSAANLGQPNIRLHGPLPTCLQL